MEQLSDIDLLNIIFSDSESDEESILINIIFQDIKSERGSGKIRKKRKYLVHPYYSERGKILAYQNAFLPLNRNISDPELFQNYMRMSSSQFDELLSIVGTAINKEEFIQPSTRLAITLRYLATGESQESLSTVYKCSPTYVDFIIEETTRAIINALRPKVFKKLNEAHFLDVANGFEEHWNFPHCIGALNEKHISIQAPSHYGSMYLNYKKVNSIVLIAISDHDYNFTMCDIGVAGKQFEGNVFQNSRFGKQLYSNSIPLPQPTNLSDHCVNMPYVFVADDAFGLHKNLMKPFSQSPLTREQKIYNYRLSRARRIIDNCFGILMTKWRVFRQPIIANVDTGGKIIGACLCLHNWLIQQSSPTPYISPGLVDVENSDGTQTDGGWRIEMNDNLRGLETKSFNPTTNEANETRNRFANYFSNEGAVPWQKDIINEAEVN